jgi:hypothetical protein
MYLAAKLLNEPVLCVSHHHQVFTPPPPYLLLFWVTSHSTPIIGLCVLWFTLALFAAGLVTQKTHPDVEVAVEKQEEKHWIEQQ